MRFLLSTVTLAMAISLAGLASEAFAQERAHADLKNGEGKTIGRAGLRQTKQGVLISLQIDQLAAGLHAVHVHATGRCEAPAFTSAGGILIH
ncbi:MAG TPA: superoxide dismutase family protein [Terriglobales bacterium]|nr:superoxide dismutase family protein [Terriglobales bacterium]